MISSGEETRSNDNVDGIIDSAYESLTSDDGLQSVVTGWAPYIEDLADPSRKDRLLSRVRHHFVQATKLTERLAPPMPIDPIASEIGKSSSPTIALSPAKYLIAANAQSEACFGERIGEQMTLLWLAPESRDSFQALRQEAIKGATQSQIIVSLNHRQTDAPLIAEAYAIMVETLNNPVIIVRVLEVQWTGEAAETLRSVFKLTTAELSIAEQFLRTQDMQSLADHRGATIATIRKQMKSIFGKTNTNSQAQLYHFLSLIVQSKSSRKLAAHDMWRDPLGHEKILIDPQGRKIAYTWFGDQAGTPALLSHGSLTGYLFTHDVRKAIKAAGIKIYIVCRPGFGNSDPNLDVDALEGARLATIAVMDHLGLTSVPAIGLASGTVALLYTAAREPGRISGILSFGGSVPLDNDAHYKDLPAITRVMLMLAKYSQHAVRLALRSGYRQVIKQGPSYMLQKIYGVAPADRYTTSDPDMLALLAASARMLTTFGTDTFERDFQLIIYGWRQDFEATALPLHVIQGEDDPVFLQKHSQVLAQLYPHYTLHTVKGAGQLVFLQDEAATLAAVKSHVKPER